MNTWNEFCKEVRPLKCRKNLITTNKQHIKIKKYNHISQKIDLHGKTLEKAQKDVISYLESVKQNNIKKVTIITGKSGSMLRELPIWIENNSQISSCKLKKMVVLMK